MAFFSSKSKSETEVVPMRRDITLDWQNRLWDLSRQEREYFPEQTYAEMDPRQREAMQMREQFARGMGGMVEPTMEAWRSTLTAPDVAQNPYVQGMLEQQRSQVMRGLSEAMPSIQAGMLGMNERLGGTGQGVAAGIAGRGALETLAQQAAGTQMDAYLAGLSQQQYGLGAAPGMAQFGMMPADVLGQVGAMERAEQQRAIDEARQRFEFEQEEPWQRMERFIGTYEPMSSQYTTTKSQEQVSPSALQIGSQLAGLGMAGLGMFGGGPSAGIAAGAMPGGMYSPVPAAQQITDPFQYMREYAGYRRR